MEFPHHPYQPVPINGFSYPTVAELEEHVEERVRGDSDRNLIRMWLPDQVWTQHRIAVIDQSFIEYYQTTQLPATEVHFISTKYRIFFVHQLHIFRNENLSWIICSSNSLLNLIFDIC